MLFGLLGGLCHAVVRGDHIDRRLAAAPAGENNLPVNKRENGVILANADIPARGINGSALTHDDVSSNDGFAAVTLDAKTTAC